MPFRSWLGRWTKGVDERRRTPRCQAAHLSLVQGADRGQEGQFQALGRTRDLSEGGTMIELGRELPPGSWLDVSLGIGDRLIEARGEVLACDRAEGVGYLLRVRFQKLDRHARHLVRAYVRERTAERQAAAMVTWVGI